MTERPILFSGPMVRALLDGRKTQTRRVIKNPEYFGCPTGDCPHLYQRDCDAAMALLSPYGVVGDVLWVREAFSGPWAYRDVPPRYWPSDLPIWYWADGNVAAFDATRPKPSIHMPRGASRISLRITHVRAERLQAISESDCLAEGAFLMENGFWNTSDGGPSAHDPRGAYRNLWDLINGRGSWDANPWVWAVSFERAS